MALGQPGEICWQDEGLAGRQGGFIAPCFVAGEVSCCQFQSRGHSLSPPLPPFLSIFESFRE